MENYIYDAFKRLKDETTLEEDTVKQGSKWVNKGKEGTHGTFKTKKAADAQRKAMFANKGKKATFGESIEKFPIGSTFTNAGHSWEVLDRKGDYSLLFSPTKKFMPYVVAWGLEDDGSWGQGHYFQNKDDAVEYFEDQKIYEALDDDKKIHDWYVKKYPHDALGEKINKKLTFDLLYDYLKKKKFDYDWFANDLIICDRVFNELARRKDVDYDHIYHLWIAADDTFY